MPNKNLGRPILIIKNYTRPSYITDPCFRFWLNIKINGTIRCNNESKTRSWIITGISMYDILIRVRASAATIMAILQIASFLWSFDLHLIDTFFGVWITWLYGVLIVRCISITLIWSISHGIKVDLFIVDLSRSDHEFTWSPRSLTCGYWSIDYIPAPIHL